MPIKQGQIALVKSNPQNIWELQLEKALEGVFGLDQIVVFNNPDLALLEFYQHQRPPVPQLTALILVCNNTLIETVVDIFESQSLLKAKKILALYPEQLFTPTYAFEFDCVIDLSQVSDVGFGRTLPGLVTELPDGFFQLSSHQTQ